MFFIAFYLLFFANVKKNYQVITYPCENSLKFFQNEVVLNSVTYVIQIWN